MPNILKLLPDQPLGLTDRSDERADSLGFDSYADVLARAIFETTGPFTIGVFGDWGTGKTSLMRRVQKRVDTQNDYLTIWFNAWQYQDDAHPIVPLVATVLKAIQDKLKSEQDWLSTAEKALIEALRSIVLGLSVEVAIPLLAGARLKATKGAKHTGKETPLSSLIDRSLHFGAFDLLSKVQLPTGKKIVLFIDDLDRCLPDKAIRLLESIKLVLAQPGFAFVLGLYRDAIEAHLEKRYRNDAKAAASLARDYLDKFIQLEFSIPHHAAKMQDLSRQLLAEVGEGSADGPFFRAISPLVEYLSGNPRVVVRFINSLLVAHQLLGQNQAASGTAMLDLLAVTRLLQLRWPRFYDVVVDDQIAADFALAKLRNRATQPDKNQFSHLKVQDEWRADLEAFLQNPNCQAWLAQPERRALASQNMRTEAISIGGPAGIFARDMLVITLVGSKDVRQAERVHDSLTRLRHGYSSFHQSYVLGKEPKDLTDKNVIYLVLGEEPQTAFQHSARRLSFSPPADDKVDEFAREYLAYLFGAETSSSHRPRPNPAEKARS